MDAKRKPLTGSLTALLLITAIVLILLFIFTSARNLISKVDVSISSLDASSGSLLIERSYSTAGIILTMDDAMNTGNEFATIRYRKVNSSLPFQNGHDLTRYDRNHMATSLFNLDEDSEYEVEVTLQDPDSQGGTYTGVVPLEDFIVFPSSTKQVIVDQNGLGDFRTIQEAVDAQRNALNKQYMIRVRPGVYNENVKIIGIDRPIDKPLVIMSDGLNNNAVIDGGGGTGFVVVDSSNIAFFELEIRGGTEGIAMRCSDHVKIEDSYIHDNSIHNILISQSGRVHCGSRPDGDHLIQYNVISNVDSTSSQGITIDNNGGSNIVIRENTIFGHKDNVRLCSDEAKAVSTFESDRNILNLPNEGGIGIMNSRNRELYNNFITNAGDDNLELDGLCVNARVHGNIFGDAGRNSVSIAPAMPGPFFIVRNVWYGDWGQSAVKFNANASSNNPTRNAFFYNNTFQRTGNLGRDRFNDGRDTMLTLWYDKVGEHNIPVKNILFKNNIFYAASGGTLTDTKQKNTGNSNVTFDYNNWFTLDGRVGVLADMFQWHDGSDRSFSSLAGFQATGQSLHGTYGDPLLDNELSPTSLSPGVDRGLVIPGISDLFNGAGPDIGAFESVHFGNGTPTNTPTPVPLVTNQASCWQIGANHLDGTVVNSSNPLIPGSTFNTTVMFVNGDPNDSSASTVWDERDTTPHHLGSATPSDTGRWGIVRVPLTGGSNSHINPLPRIEGDLALFNFNPTAPIDPIGDGCSLSGPSRYDCNFDWEMVEGSERFGNPICHVTLPLAGPTITPTPSPTTRFPSPICTAAICATTPLESGCYYQDHGPCQCPTVVCPNQPLVCIPSFQTANLGDRVSFSATGGASSQYEWVATLGNPAIQEGGSTFSTVFTRFPADHEANIVRVLVSDGLGGQVSTCEVLLESQLSPRPIPQDYGLREGDVVSSFAFDEDLDIYIVNGKGFKRLFVNPQIFNLYGHLGYEKVRSIEPSTRDRFETSGLFTNCESGDGKVWALRVLDEDSAVLSHVALSGDEAISQDPEFFDKVFCINNAEEALYPKTSNPYTSLNQVPDYKRY